MRVQKLQEYECMVHFEHTCRYIWDGIKDSGTIATGRKKQPRSLKTAKHDIGRSVYLPWGYGRSSNFEKPAHFKRTYYGNRDDVTQPGPTTDGG